jgi:hypothetical protein
MTIQQISYRLCHTLFCRGKVKLFMIIFLLWNFSVLTLQAEVPDRYKINNPEGKGEVFLGGVYIYPPSFDKITLDAHLRYLAQQGVNHVILSVWSAATDPTVSELIDMCKKYGLRITFQIYSGYIWGVSDFTSAKAITAADFIDAYDDPIILAYGVREEPYPNNPDSFIDLLLEHYRDISSYCTLFSPNNPVPFFLLHNNHNALVDASAYTGNGRQPIAIGSDYYYMRWYFYNGGFIVTPTDSLVYNAFLGDRPYALSSQYYTAVITNNARRTTYAKSYLQSTYPDDYSRILTLAQDGNQGVSEDGDNIKFWEFYSSPKNLTRARMWQTIADGSHGILNWSCDPGFSYSYMGLLGPDSKGSDGVIEEYTSTIRELQPYAWIINRMALSANEGVSDDEDDEFPSSQVSAAIPTLVWKGNFSLSGYNAHISVVVNGSVGSWGDGNNPRFLSTSQIYRIDDDGKLIDYTPYTTARTITLHNEQTSLGSMYDLATGQLIGAISGTVDLMPGQGKFIWIGNQSDLNEVRLACGFTGLTKIIGHMNGDVKTPENVSVITPSNNFSNNSSYLVKSSALLQLGTRYRVHVTASSPDGATLGVYKTGFDSTDTIDWSKSASMIWNKTLTSTPQTFTSRDFEFIPETVAMGRVLYYRSNQTGTLNIHDSWIEDISHVEPPKHMRAIYPIDDFSNNSSYLVKSSALLQLGTRYRVHVTASSPDGAKLGVYKAVFDSTDTIDWSKSTSMIWDKTLTSTPQTFTSGDFEFIPGIAAMGRVLYYRSNQTGTLNIHDSWIEDVSHEVNVTSSNLGCSEITLDLDTTKNYRIHVIAKKNPSVYNNSGLEITYRYYDSSGATSMEYQEIYSNSTALNEDYQQFTSSSFSGPSSSTPFMRVVFSNVHYDRENGETLVIKKAWVEEVQ